MPQLMILLTSSIWVTIVPVLVINAILIATLIIFAFSKKRPPMPEEIKKRHSSKFLNTFFRAWWFWVTDPIAKFLIKVRLSPNMITTIGLLISCLSAYLFAEGLFGWAGWVMVFGASFDMFDGRVARITNRSSRSGAYYDSVMDRVGEGVVFLGIAWCFRESWLLPITIIGLIGSMLVSYTKARGEGVGVVCNKGIMQRPERIVYIGVSSILQPVADTILSIFWANPAPVLLIGALLVIAVMTCVTAIQRMVYIMNELDTMDRDETDKSLSQVLASLSSKEGREKLFEVARYGYDRSAAQKQLCVMILVDGVNYSVFKELIQKGELPNINRYIIEPGVFKKAVTTFPSTTGPAFTPFITGCWAGTCDIPGIRWFDRRVPPTKRLTIKRFRDYYGWGSYALDSDLSKDVRTIFEYSRRAYNIMGMLNRGAGVLRDPAFFKSPLLFYKAMRQNDIETVERTAFRMFVSALNKAPDFIFYYFPTIDKLSHENHAGHDLVRAAYRRLDDYVGKIVELLKSQGLFETTSLILSSDHGHSEVKKHFDLDAFLEERFKTLYAPMKLREWVDAEAMNFVSGNSMSNIYLRKDGWEEFNYFEEMEKDPIINELLENEAVCHLAVRSRDGGAFVVSRHGLAHIREENGGVRYNVVDGDPFGFGEMPEYISSEDVPRLTWNSQYPDAPSQVAQIFRSDRAGDIVVSASPGYDLRARFEDPPHKSTHGSLHHEHMFVPLCINAKIGAEQIRTTDVFPTMLKILGITPEHHLDGRALL